ncbi:B12-binding domain-containing radical SAM protein [Dactylosporangium matsuzakiense]|uniref:B12-binding domain-containing radical SAM protein n=1 Tax=Dactylosporangium matsuzakiense TaxID=53360 RepID=UPI0022F3194E|nr:radical SAM protein [Dactylosporangium matsuzakiense]
MAGLQQQPDWAPDVIAGIDEARRVLRDLDDFYRPQRLLSAKYTLARAGSLFTAGHPRLRFGKYSYSSSPYDSFEEIDKAVAGEAGPLADYFRSVTVPSLLARRPDMIGFSVPYFSQLVPTFLLAEAIRAADPHIHLCFGGPVVTWGREVLTADPRFGRWIDSFVVGEGDEVIVHLAEALAGRRELATVPNLVRYHDGKVEARLRPDLHPDLDQLPTPDFTMLPLRRYFAPHQVICLNLTRGCYYNKCAFCNYAFIKLTPYRMRSPTLVAADIAEIGAATGQRVFCLESDVILPTDLRRISEAMLDRGIDVQWHGVARFEKGFTRELAATMRRAGCIRLYMGMESANDRTLGAMSKGVDRARISDILAMFQAEGIAVEAGIFSGFPSETAEEANDTYQFVRNHSPAITRADIGTFRLLKGSPVAEQPQLYGITIGPDPAKRWYHLEFDADATGGNIVERIQKLYPQVALVDVPEDILYTARFGPDALRRFFRNPGFDEFPSGVDPLPDDAVPILGDGWAIQTMTVTNSGAVHLDSDAPGAGPTFEKSALSVTVLVNRAGHMIHPVGEAEERILSLADGRLSVAEIRAALVQEETATAFAWLLHHRALRLSAQ